MNSDQLHSNKGFTLSEILLTIGLIAICASLVLHHFSHATAWAKGKMEKAQLGMLNSALELFKLEAPNEAILVGKNDLEHNRNVIDALQAKGYLHSKKLLIERLTSKGQGKNFIFSGYGNAQEIVQDGETGKTEIPNNFLKWMQSDCQEAWKPFKNQQPDNTINNQLKGNLRVKQCLMPEVLEGAFNEYYFKK